jgi:hypothetical protein
MGAEEKQLFNAMAKELAAVKRWLPILVFSDRLQSISLV